MRASRRGGVPVGRNAEQLVERAEADGGGDGHHDGDEGEDHACDRADPDRKGEDQCNDRDDTSGKAIESSFVPGHVWFLS